MRAATISRVLLGLAALALATDATLHWIFFGRPVLAAIDQATTLPPLLQADFKVLWIADVSTLFGVAAALGWGAIRPAALAPLPAAILALIPLALGVLVFAFGAPSYAGYNMVGAAVVALLGALIKARAERQTASPAPSG